MTREEIKAQIFARYPYRIELHAHTTPASTCSDVSPKEMAQIYHDLGYHALCITNHFSIPTDGCDKEKYLALYLSDFEETKRAGEALGLRVYLCAEIRFTENSNDYLLYGVDEGVLSQVYDLLSFGIEHFSKAFDRKRTLLLQAHPRRKNIVEISPDLVDGLEVYNMHPNHNSRVAQVSRLAAEHGVRLVTAGTDFHHKGLSHEGLSALRSTRLPEDSFDLARLLREEDYVFSLGADNLLIP